jgi:hypothetical protein
MSKCEGCLSRERLVQRLLNKVNAVTAFWRHNGQCYSDDLNELCERQIEVEKFLDEMRAETGGESVATCEQTDHQG